MAGGSPLELQERNDPAVPIARAAIHQAPDIGSELRNPGARPRNHGFYACRRFAQPGWNGRARRSLRTPFTSILRCLHRGSKIFFTCVSTLLKNSAAFANEARIVAIVCIDMAGEPARSADHKHIRVLRRGHSRLGLRMRTPSGRTVSRAGEDIGKALQRTEANFTVGLAAEAEMRLFR